METHTGSQFARDASVCDRGLKMLSNRHKSTRIERLVIIPADKDFSPVRRYKFLDVVICIFNMLTGMNLGCTYINTTEKT